jgi:serine/threonine-protein kinase RsbW
MSARSRPVPAPAEHRDPAAELALPGSRESVPQLRRAMVQGARAAGAPTRTCQHVALAVSEAATNAVLHAFGEAPGLIRVALWRSPDGLEIVVADNGRGLALRNDSPGLGMGLGLIAKVSDRIEIDSAPGGGTRVHMWFGWSDA